MTKKILKTLSTIAVTGTLVFSQTPIGVKPAMPESAAQESGSPTRQMEAARPLLGYVTDGATLRSVVGMGSIAQWGTPMTLPAGASAIFLPPRQEYALLAGTELSVARLTRSTAYSGNAIPNAMPRPERVAFSPSGEAAALFSSSERKIQVITSLATKAEVRQNLPLAGAELLQLAVSDDGELLVASFEYQPPMFSWRGSSWQPIATSYRPDAWTFLPRSHDLVLTDRSQRVIVVVQEAEKSPSVERLLVTDNQAGANLLLPNKSGDGLLAVATGTSEFWTIDLTSGSAKSFPAPGVIDSLALMRDGQSFLVSSHDRPIVVRLGRNLSKAAATKTSY